MAGGCVPAHPPSARGAKAGLPADDSVAAQRLLTLRPCPLRFDHEEAAEGLQWVSAQRTVATPGRKVQSGGADMRSGRAE